MSASIPSEAVSGPKILGVPRTTALLIISTGLLATISLSLMFMFLGAQSVSARNTRLLRIVTSPDSKSEPLVNSAGYQGRGEVFYRESVPTLLVVLSGLPPAPDSLHYILWSIKNGEAQSFDEPVFDSEGVARIPIEEIDPGGIDEVALHLENIDARVPTGPLVMSWKHG
jgi:hypothetical protein